MTHSLLNRDDESSISPTIIQYSPVLRTPFLQREFPKRISHSNPRELTALLSAARISNQGKVAMGNTTQY
jgi:hypothetical protein